MKKNLKKSLLLFASLSLFSCVRAQQDQAATQITLNVPAHFGSQAVVPLELNSGIVPTTVNELNCFATLVSGPEAGMSRNICDYKNTAKTFPVGKFYGGFFKGVATASSSMTFEVPNGNDRVIRLIGFKVDTSSAAGNLTSAASVCSNFFHDDELQNFISEPYILAEQGGIVMKGEPLTLDLTATFNAAFRVGNCKGPDFPNTGTGGTGAGLPYKFGISFQDDLGSGSKKLSAGSCVAVRMQIQDSKGNRADLSSNPTINGKVRTLLAGTSIGTFYHTGGRIGCAVGTEIAPISGDVSFGFKNAGVAFSDFLMFFRPTDAQGGLGQITVMPGDTGASAGLQPGVASFAFDVGGATLPIRYAIYDLYNNKSTLSSLTSATRNIVRANECRAASIQFEDSYGVPTKLMTGTGPYQSIIVTPSTSSIQFYANSTDCSVGSGTPSFVAPMGAYTPYGTYNFYYKVAPSTTTPVNFSFSVTSNGTGTPPIYSGDLTSGSNFWEWKN